MTKSDKPQAAANPMASMPGFDAMRAQQEAFFKAMASGIKNPIMGSVEPAPANGEENLDDIKKQLSELQGKLNKMSK